LNEVEGRKVKEEEYVKKKIEDEGVKGVKR